MRLARYRDLPKSLIGSSVKNVSSMAVVLQVGDRAITTEEIVPLLRHYQLLPQLLQEMIIDGAIAAITCTPEELSRACQEFYTQQQLPTDEARQAWQKQQGLTQLQVEALATRKLRIEKFKQATWGHKLESYFLNRKGQLDRVIYSLIRTSDEGIVQELYFRLQAGEQSFSELAQKYSQGAEAQTGGLIGPVELSSPHPKLVQMLSASQPGQLWPPVRIDKWLAVVRLEKFIPAQLDEACKARLLHELFTTWLKEQVSQQLLAINSESVG